MSLTRLPPAGQIRQRAHLMMTTGPVLQASRSLQYLHQDLQSPQQEHVSLMAITNIARQASLNPPRLPHSCHLQQHVPLMRTTCTARSVCRSQLTLLLLEPDLRLPLDRLRRRGRRLFRLRLSRRGLLRARLVMDLLDFFALPFVMGM